jgi:hypothetical protein
MTQNMYYLNENLYHYYIGRKNQSVNEQVMIRQIDQQILVNKIMIDSVDLSKVSNSCKRNYMLNYLEIITTVSSILLIKSGTEENMAKKAELWNYMRQRSPDVYRILRGRIFGRMLNMQSAAARRLTIFTYRVCQAIFGFN